MRLIRIHVAMVLAVTVLVLAGVTTARGESETPVPPADEQVAEPAGPPASAAPPAPAPPAPAPPPEANAPANPGGVMESICLMVESAARANDLPLEFFARVIWQESRFRPDAVGPVTRSGRRAQGIAQFMPGTASERGLLDPFDPVAALPKSAEFLAELRGEFGNIGLAAAAYNAGPRRLRDFISGRGGLPGETRRYVQAITGRPVEEWVSLARDAKDGITRPTSCRQLAALLREQPTFFIGELERRVREGSARPWGVQLSAGFSREHVLAAYGTLERRYRGVLENTDPMILRLTFRSRGTHAFYQVRVGVDSRADATRLCGRLHAAGGACMVLRNSRGTPEQL